jgi:hypothetical protein
MFVSVLSARFLHVSLNRLNSSNWCAVFPISLDHRSIISLDRDRTHDPHHLLSSLNLQLNEDRWKPHRAAFRIGDQSSRSRPDPTGIYRHPIPSRSLAHGSRNLDFDASPRPCCFRLVVARFLYLGRQQDPPTTRFDSIEFTDSSRTSADSTAPTSTSTSPYTHGCTAAALHSDHSTVPSLRRFIQSAYPPLKSPTKTSSHDPQPQPQALACIPSDNNP